MKKTLVLILALLTAASVALAAPSVSARMQDGQMYITWTDCGCAEATLSVSRDNWPILVAYVRCADGGMCLPSGYTQAPGAYSAQIRCAHGCTCAAVCVEGDSASPATPVPTQQPTPAPTQQPTAAPTQQPTATPTQQPTAAPTQQPTATPTQQPTPAPTEQPTSAPTQQPTPAPTQQPTRRPTAEPTQESGGEQSGLAAEVVRQVNQERSARGLGTLETDPELTRAAAVRAREIVEVFSHTRPDGSSWSTVSSAASGENIAKGHDSADRVMAAWMSSEGHRANILRAGFTRIGVCAYEVGGVLYWVQLFGR